MDIHIRLRIHIHVYLHVYTHVHVLSHVVICPCLAQVAVERLIEEAVAAFAEMNLLRAARQMVAQCVPLPAPSSPP